MTESKFKAVVDAHNWTRKKIIVAVSGGSDSMALASLALANGMDIVIAHCNFGLRAEESEGDQVLVAEWASQNEVPFYTQRFDVRGELDRNAGNLQELARDLRYQWFEQLRKDLGFELIATAHHAEDSMETMMINFFKGTGISGLHGILPQQGRIIRPLLTFEKNELADYLIQAGINWREDSSNAKTDYLRNKIRAQLMPVLADIFPNVKSNLLNNTQRFREAELLYNNKIEEYRRKLIEARNSDHYIPVLKLRNYEPLKTILWELVRPFGFTAGQLPQIEHLLIAETGKFVDSSANRIIRDRNFLIITPIQKQESTHVLVEETEGETNAPTFSLRRRVVENEEKVAEMMCTADEREAWIPVEKLKFPLVLRPRKTGDYFYPLGMKAKKKKVSRFLIDKKVPLHEKDKVWVLESEGKIVWVIGYRIDDRFKVEEKDKNILHFKVEFR